MKRSPKSLLSGELKH